MEQAAGRGAELPAGWGCCRSPGTAEIGADPLTLSAYAGKKTGCLKQATMFSSCLLSLPKLLMQGVEISSCHLSGGCFIPALHCKLQKQ